MTIRHRLLRILLAICLISFMLVGALAFYGGLRTKYEMERLGVQLSNSTTESVEETMEYYERKKLLALIKEYAEHFDLVLHQFHQDVGIIAGTAGEIFEHPERYSRTILYNSSAPSDGWSTYMIVKPGVDINEPRLRNEIEIAANAQDILRNVARGYDFAVTTFTAYEEGFDIAVGVDSEEEGVAINFYSNPNYEYRDLDFTARPWYHEAKVENTLIFTDAILSADSPVMAIFCAMPIRANGNFIGVAGMGFNVDDISHFVLKATVGETGFGFIVNHNGQVIISPKKEGEFAVKENPFDLRGSKSESLADAVKLMLRGGSAVLPVTVDGKDYYLAFAPLDHIDWTFCAIIEVDEVRAPALAVGEDLISQMDEFIDSVQSVFAEMIPAYGVALLLLLALVAALSTRLSEHFVRPIRKLSDGVRDIAMGNFDNKLDIKTGDEIESLSTTFNAMTDELQEYIRNLNAVTAEKERIAAELNVAESIQKSMLPREFPPFPDKTEFDIYATMKAAKEVGGDFYDFYMVDENHLVVTIADVSGKSIPAALFMMSSKTILKNFVMMSNKVDDLAAVMTLANAQLYENNEELMFVTVFLAMLDLKTGKLIYVSAAHNNPLIRHDGKYTFLPRKKTMALGVSRKAKYEQQELQMSKGDILFLYTDGVTEAENRDKELYSNERLEAFLNSTKDLSLEELLAAVRQSIKQHADGAEQSDDITMLALRFNG